MKALLLFLAAAPASAALVLESTSGQLTSVWSGGYVGYEFALSGDGFSFVGHGYQTNFVWALSCPCLDGQPINYAVGLSYSGPAYATLTVGGQSYTGYAAGGFSINQSGTDMTWNFSMSATNPEMWIPIWLIHDIQLHAAMQPTATTVPVYMGDGLSRYTITSVVYSVVPSVPVQAIPEPATLLSSFAALLLLGIGNPTIRYFKHGKVGV